MTGADFNYVLGSAQGAESHFRWLGTTITMVPAFTYLTISGSLSEGSSLSFAG